MSPVRCSVLGNAGGGKSILSRAIAAKTKIELHELDNYLWKDNWDSVPAAEFDARHENILEGDEWIIDGFGSPESTRKRLLRSTLLILVDLPIWLHFAMASDRQLAWSKGELKHPPGGMSLPPPTKRLFELIWTIHIELMPAVRVLADDMEARGGKVERVFDLERLRELQFNPHLLLDG